MIRRRFAPYSIFTLLVITALAACGGSSGGKPDPTPPINGNGGNNNTGTTETGIFIDSPVINIGYRTETHEGVTNENGEYNYEPGETVVFFIGDLEFPPVLASGVVTPLDIVGTTDTGDTRVVNIIRLLQTLDVDGDPSNGLTISQSAKDNATQVDFDLPEEEFASSPEVANLIVNGGQDSVPSELVSTEEAVTHFENSLADEDIHYSNASSLAGSWVVDGDGPFTMITFDTTNGTYFAMDTNDDDEVHLSHGTYVQDPATGLMSSMTVIYPPGHEGDGEDVGFIVDGHSLTAEIYQEGELINTETASRVVANGLVGTWVYRPTAADASEARVIVLVFMEDDSLVRMLIADDLDPAGSGAEVTGYTYDSSTGSLSTDTGDDSAVVTFSGNSMTAVITKEDGETETMIFNRL